MSGQLYKEVRTKKQLNELLHYGHSLPVRRGYTDEYVREHYPDWTWNALVRVLTAAGVYVGRGGSPPCCDDRVVRVHFDSEQAWRVEWDDGTNTVGPAVPGTTAPDAARGRETIAFDIGTGLRLEDLGI
ncbi:hypothetical protein [Microbacterium sp. A93]|uniref:hypothetical protein n=1 Tax=Microbacterium sp. A93 TaxID=3450716 RepID=UPI003F42F4A4